MIPSQIIFLSLGVLTFILALTGNLIYTHRELLKRSTLNHTKDWVIKAASCIPPVLMFCLACINISSWLLKLSLSSVLVMAWFWVLFSGIYGIRTGDNFFFTGTQVSKNLAWSDRILKKLKKWMQVGLKLSACGVTLYLYIKFL